MLVFLRRLAYPLRLSDLCKEFGGEETAWGRVINWMVDHVMTEHAHLLEDNVAFFSSRFPEYARAIAAKIALPNAQLHTIGFIDGTVRPMCRPSDVAGTHDAQRRVYSGHKRVHALKFQGVVVPDGMIMDLWGPVPGSRNDGYLLAQSQINRRLAQAQVGAPIQYKLYGDAAYRTDTHITSGHKGANLTRAQVQENRSMSKARECVEWGFGKIVVQFAFCDFKKNLKVFLQPVGRLYYVAAVLTNFHTCLYGSQTSTYFGLRPPSLEDYTSRV
jgi:hypothetical protein